MKFPNGYGSVICLGKKRRKPYAVRVTVDRVLYEKDGKLCSKQKYAYLGTFTTSKEAHMYLAEYNANRVDSDPVLVAKEKAKPVKGVTFKELYEEWYMRKEASPQEYSASTFTHYKSSFNKLSEYHNKPITFFTSVEIQNIMDSFKDFSKTYVVQILTVLKGVLDLAYKKKLIAKNEFDMCEMYYKKKNTEMHKAFTKDEIKILWEHSNDPIIRMVIIGIYTGFRPSELIEIRTENVHIEESYIQEGIKTNAGKNRLVPIHDKIKLLLNDVINDSPYLFYHTKGSHLSYSAYLRSFNKALNKIGITDHKPHDVRHTCSTLLAEANVPLLHRQKILGHSSRNVTDDVYVHLDLSVLIKDINMIEV